MSSMILATALELARLHGVRYAAFYLLDSGIDVEVAVDLLGSRVKSSSRPRAKQWRARKSSSTAHGIDSAQSDAARKILDLWERKPNLNHDPIDKEQINEDCAGC